MGNHEYCMLCGASDFHDECPLHELKAQEPKLIKRLRQAEERLIKMNFYRDSYPELEELFHISLDMRRQQEYVRETRLHLEQVKTKIGQRA